MSSLRVSTASLYSPRGNLGRWVEPKSHSQMVLWMFMYDSKFFSNTSDLTQHLNRFGPVCNTLASCPSRPHLLPTWHRPSGELQLHIFIKPKARTTCDMKNYVRVVEIFTSCNLISRVFLRKSLWKCVYGFIFFFSSRCQINVGTGH